MKSICNIVSAGALAAAGLLAVAAGIPTALADGPDAATPAPAGTPSGLPPLGGPPPAWGGPPGPGGGPPGPPDGMPFGGPERLFGQLALSAGQQQSIRSILGVMHPALDDLHEQMRVNTDKLRETQPDDPNYAAVVAEVSGANSTLLTQLITQEADFRAQLYGVLNSAQKTQLVALEAKMQAQMQREVRRDAPPR